MESSGCPTNSSGNRAPWINRRGGPRRISRASIGKCGLPRSATTGAIPGSSACWNACCATSRTSRACLRATLFQMTRRATFARGCMNIGSPPGPNIEPPALGGSAKSGATIFPQSHRKISATRFSAKFAPGDEVARNDKRLCSGIFTSHPIKPLSLLCRPRRIAPRISPAFQALHGWQSNTQWPAFLTPQSP